MLCPRTKVFELSRSLLFSYNCSAPVLVVPRCHLFWESDRKSGYNKADPKVPFTKKVRMGFKELKGELEMFKNEFKEKIITDPILVYHPGVIDKQWELHTQNDLDQWTVTADSDHNEGHSTCSFSINSQGNGLFSGVLSTQVPKDGIHKRAGYCAIRSKRARKSFKRDDYLNWIPYTHLVIRCRGDGRSYMMNISTEGYFDQLWNDMYSYVLFTRGGPYWQLSKIPFSKFFFSSKGRIQDLQNPIPLDKVSHFGITAGDKVSGPFSLEIDYIGVEFDPTHTEETAYEMYRTAKNIASN